MNQPVQGSNAWLTWRKDGICGSDMPVILGTCPYRSKLMLYKDKLSLENDSSINPFVAMTGHEVEERARALYELLKDLEVPATLAVHSEYPWLKASLDGANLVKDMADQVVSIWECKHVGADYLKYLRDNVAKSVKNKIKANHYDQIQHQLMVTGAQFCDYMPCTAEWVGEKGSKKLKITDHIILRIAPNTEYCNNVIFPAASDMWEDIKEGREPEMGPLDARPIKSKKVQQLLSAWADAKKKEAKLKNDFEAWETLRKDLGKEIAELLEHPLSSYRNFRVTKGERIGKIQYDQVPQLEGVDLEPYRADSTDTVSITQKETESKSKKKVTKKTPAKKKAPAKKAAKKKAAPKKKAAKKGSKKVAKNAGKKKTPVKKAKAKKKVTKKAAKKSARRRR